MGLHQLLLIFVIWRRIHPIYYSEDFLALHPFSDAEVIATLQNAGHTWKDLHIQFNAAFLSGDYEDEDEKICSRVQGEKESIRDFTQIVYMYHVHVQRKNKY